MIARLYDLALVWGLFVAASGCGLWALEGLRLRASGRIRHALFAGGLGLGLLGYVTFVLGLAAVLRREVIAGAFLLGLVMGLAGWWRFWRAGRVEGKEAWRRLRRRSWPEGALLAFLGVLAGINLLAALAPVIGVDELIYRVAAADLYLRHERLYYLPSMWLHQQPQQVQMIQLWGMSLGSHSTAQVVQWGMGLLLVVALVDLGRRDMPLVWALLAGAIFYCYSDVLVLSGRASPDLANGLFLLLAVLAWLEWLETGVGRWLVLAGVLAGLFAAGARLQGAYGAVSLAILVVVYGWRRRGWRFSSALARGLGVGFVAFLAVAPWYVKSYVQTGSPTWPLLMGVFGARDWTPDAQAYVLGIQGEERGVGQWLSPGRMVTAPWDLVMAPERFHSGVMGPLILATLPFAFLIRLPQRVGWALAASAVLAPLWYVSYPRLRAYVAGVGLLSVVVGYLLWRIFHAVILPAWGRAAILGFVLAWLLLGVGVAWRFHGWAAPVVLGWAEEARSLSARLAQPDVHFFWYDDYQALNARLPAGSRLLLYDSRGYYLRYDYDRYDLLAKRETRPERLRDPRYVAEQVQRLGSNYVVLWPEPRHSTAYEPSNWLEDTLRGLCGAHWPIIYRSASMIVCEVRPLPGGAAP
ncbi:MAG: hypothetical protein HY704_01555 [Gemmatimonadetes bacterium]|nr:hypothetical protein [Gemmatimonadota bacterium]